MHASTDKGQKTLDFLELKPAQCEPPDVGAENQA